MHLLLVLYEGRQRGEPDRAFAAPVREVYLLVPDEAGQQVGSVGTVRAAVQPHGAWACC